MDAPPPQRCVDFLWLWFARFGYVWVENQPRFQPPQALIPPAPAHSSTAPAPTIPFCADIVWTFTFWFVYFGPRSISRLLPPDPLITTTVWHLLHFTFLHYTVYRLLTRTHCCTPPRVTFPGLITYPTLRWDFLRFFLYYPADYIFHTTDAVVCVRTL